LRAVRIISESAGEGCSQRGGKKKTGQQARPVPTKRFHQGDFSTFALVSLLVLEADDCGGGLVAKGSVAAVVELVPDGGFPAELVASTLEG